MRQKAAPKSRLVVKVGLFLLQYRQSGLVLGYTTAYLAPRCVTNLVLFASRATHLSGRSELLQQVPSSWFVGILANVRFFPARASPRQLLSQQS